MRKIILLISGIVLTNLFASGSFATFLNTANNNEWYLKSFNKKLYLSKYNINSYPRFVVWKISENGKLNCFYTNDGNSESKLIKAKYKKCEEELNENTGIWIKIY